MSRVSTNKEIAELEDLARDQKWEPFRLKNGHYEWVSPSGARVTIASSPSDWRAIENIKADLKAEGLILNKTEWKTVKRLRSRQRDSEKAMLIELSDILAQCYDVTKKDAEWLAQEFVWRQLYAVIQRNGDGKVLGLNFKCPCGKQPLHPQGYIRHIQRCTVFLEGEEQMDRNIHEPPPLEQRLDCPDCGQWYWINQPEHLERHMRSIHKKVKCYSCGGTFATSRISAHQKTCTGALRPNEVDIREPDKEDQVLASPARSQTHERVNAIATPEELALLEDYKPPAPEPEPVVTNGHSKRGTGALNRGLADHILKVLLDLGPEGLKDDNCVETMRELVKPEFKNVTYEVMNNSLYLLDVKKGAIVRETNRRTRRTTSIRHASFANATTPPPKEPDPMPPVAAARPTPPPPPRPATVSPIRVDSAGDITDDDLWAMLETVLQKPVKMTRENFSVINDWFASTRKLYKLQADE